MQERFWKDLIVQQNLHTLSHTVFRIIQDGVHIALLLNVELQKDDFIIFIFTDDLEDVIQTALLLCTTTKWLFLLYIHLHTTSIFLKFIYHTRNDRWEICLSKRHVAHSNPTPSPLTPFFWAIFIYLRQFCFKNK